jgi:uncharacterized protein YegL
MKNKKTIYQFILDKSGSMASCADATIKGFNAQLDIIRSLKNEFPDQEYLVSLTTFNGGIDHLFRDAPADFVPTLNAMNFQPNGSTSLLDAIGFSINKINEAHQDDIQNDEASVVVVILTDGQENTSRYYTYHQIAAMIRHLEGSGKWSFSFIGADIDAFHTSQMLSIKQENVMAFDKKDINQMMMDVGESMRHYSASKHAGNVKTSIFDIFDKKDRRSK